MFSSQSSWCSVHNCLAVAVEHQVMTTTFSLVVRPIKSSVPLNRVAAAMPKQNKLCTNLTDTLSLCMCGTYMCLIDCYGNSQTVPFVLPCLRTVWQTQLTCQRAMTAVLIVQQHSWLHTQCCNCGFKLNHKNHREHLVQVTSSSSPQWSTSQGPWSTYYGDKTSPY